MKKIALVSALVIFLSAAGSGLVFSYGGEDHGGGDDDAGNKPMGMMKEGMPMMHGKGQMMHGMMGMMMPKSMVASGDGGVVVLSGNQLLKYDKDLNLIKEAEIKMDTEGMHKMMMEMKEKMGMVGDKSSEEAPGSDAPVSVEDHGKHH